MVAALALLPLLADVVATTAFNCHDSLISDDWREVILKLHNDNRRNVAKGLQKGQAAALLPVATKMNQLNWDCAAEEFARVQAASCGSTVPNVPLNYGSLTKSTRISGTCDLNALTRSAVRDIWKKGTEAQPTQAYVAANTDFNLMAYEDTDGVGCSYKRCSSNLYLVCFYNQNPARLGQAPVDLYRTGPATCVDCPQVNGVSTCVNALCETTLTAAPLTHKECAGANKHLMTDQLRDTALYIHNHYRRLLASGWAKDGKIGYAKPAAAMPQLKYDCDIEDAIMADLQNCPSTATAIQQPYNFRQYPQYDVSREAALEATIAEWWSALATTGVPDNKYVENDMKNKPLGNYVNMAYDKAKKVGCGVQTCTRTGKTLVQCGYDVDTFISDGDQIYQIAPKTACSGCKKAGMNCSPLGALCVR